MKKKKHVVYKRRKHLIKNRSVFILSRWTAALTVLLIVFLLIIIGGKISPIAGLFFRPTPTPSTPDKILEPALTDNEYINMSIKELSRLKSVGVDRIGIKEVVKRDWGNSSLGCPQSGKLYAQMITPGYLIVLTLDNSDYFYHGGLNKVVLCQNR